ERGVGMHRSTSAGIPKDVWQPPVTMPSGVPIRKVRLIRRDMTIRAVRTASANVKPGSTHHLALFERTVMGKRGHDAIFISMLEAAQRVKTGVPLISRAHPESNDAKFIMSLAAGELVLLTVDGSQRLYRYNTAASTTKQMTFYPHASATDAGKLTKYPASLMKLNPVKVTVDPIGRIRWAND